MRAQLCPTFASPWTVAKQAPPSKGLLKQEYWRRLSFPSSGNLPNPGIQPALAGGFLLEYHLGGPKMSVLVYCCSNKLLKT